MADSYENPAGPAMQEINLDLLRPGQTLARDAVHTNGRVLVAAGTAVTASQLRILKAWGVYSVAIHTPPAATAAGNLPDEFDPERHRALYEAVASRFRHTDLSDPVFAELFRLRLQKAL